MKGDVIVCFSCAVKGGGSSFGIVANAVTSIVEDIGLRCVAIVAIAYERVSEFEGSERTQRWRFMLILVDTSIEFQFYLAKDNTISFFHST